MTVRFEQAWPSRPGCTGVVEMLTHKMKEESNQRGHCNSHDSIVRTVPQCSID
jgi:hypothetical protein